MSKWRKRRSIRLEDLLDDEEHVVTCESIQPTAKQAEAFSAPERFILYGGAMGGGKTTWLCAYAIELSQRYPQNVGYLARHELRSFKRTTLVTLQEHMPWELVAQHHKTENYIRFKNGSIIYYGGLGDDRKAIDRLKSMELGWFGIDQAEETTEKFFFMLATRLRLRTPYGVRYKGLLTANPEPNWIKARFIDNPAPDHRFIPALPKDNPYLPQDYEQSIRAMDIPEELKRAWLEGDWEAISTTNSVFDPNQVTAAMQRDVEVREDDEEAYGLDVAEFGGDETVLVKRKGPLFEFKNIWLMQDPMETTGKVIRALDFNRSIPINVDAIGSGSGPYYRLKELGYAAVPIRGSERPSERNRERYKNKRTELHFYLRSILPYIRLPRDNKLRSQMCSIRYRVLSNGIIAIESKEEMRRRGLHSPDRLDAIILAAAPDEYSDDKGAVWHAGMRETTTKKKKHHRLLKDDSLPWEEQRRVRRWEEDWEDDSEGKVYIH